MAGGFELPTGTVTFLFTDIESSTWLLQHLGDDYDRVLHEHNRLLREAWAAYDGYEISTEGDAFFVAFDDEEKAVRAALAGQIALAEHEWPVGGRVRVRMGIHTGEARLYGRDYVGLAVHQAARIASAAHGDQVIVSDETRSASADGLGPDVAFADLGAHRLKDLAHPVRLFQLAHPELTADFPPPRTLTVMPNNFPLQLTTFVGREDDIRGVREALTTSRLVTLSGAGGVGKTRLALQVGAEVLDDFPDGAWLVDLAPLSDPALVPGLVAATLGVREQPGRAIIDTLTDQLISKRLLVVLDNCEHVIDACAKVVHQLVVSCPELKVLATSREALNVPGEVAVRLRSLRVPAADEAEDIERLAREESIRLFVQRGRSIRDDFDLTVDNSSHVTQICRRLDGLPLAIELAAARLRAMSPQEIAERLDDRFRLLTGGTRTALPRQRTLEAAVAWSYDLLSEPERRLFDRLSVFAGGCTLDAAERVRSDEEIETFDVVDLMTHLVDRSLLIAEEDHDGRTRYRLLETLRQFGRDRLLASGEVPATRDRHLAWAVDIAPQLPPQTGAWPPPEFAAEVDNLRAAIEWSIESGDLASGLRIVAAAWFGHRDEREYWYERLLPAGNDVPTKVHQKALRAAGENAFGGADWAVGAERFRRAADVAGLSGDHYEVAMSLAYGAACREALGDEETAGGWYEESLAAARRSRSNEALTRSLIFLAWHESGRHIARAEQAAIEADALSRQQGSRWDKAHALEVLGYILCLKKDYRRAGQILAEALRMFEEVLRTCSAHAFETVAAWAAMVARFEVGADVWGAAERIRQRTGVRPRPWERDVYERWLPRILEELDDIAFEAARDRGMRRSYEDALAFAERELTATH